ncbi:MAG: hypothetical protein ACLQGV_02415 [Bryobacteraceae bacterium]
MTGWRKLALLAAGFGGGFAVVMAAIVGGWAWYQGRPVKPKPWDSRAIVATFDYPDTESGAPEGPSGSSPDIIVLYYTLENTTEIDYRMPAEEQIEVDGRLKREKSLTSGSLHLPLDKEPVFIPSGQRRRFAVHLHYPMKVDLGPEPRTKEEHRKKWKLIADYMKKELPNLDGFVVFDSANRYQINLPNGWDNIDLR